MVTVTTLRYGDGILEFGGGGYDALEGGKVARKQAVAALLLHSFALSVRLSGVL